MTDIVDIALSADASSVADSILEMGLFKNKSDVMIFAAAYVIKNNLKTLIHQHIINRIIVVLTIVIVRLILMENGLR